MSAAGADKSTPAGLHPALVSSPSTPSGLRSISLSTALPPIEATQLSADLGGLPKVETARLGRSARHHGCSVREARVTAFRAAQVSTEVNHTGKRAHLTVKSVDGVLGVAFRTPMEQGGRAH